MSLVQWVFQASVCLTTDDEQCVTQNQTGRGVIFNPLWSNVGVSNFLSSGFCFCLSSPAGSETPPHIVEGRRSLPMQRRGATDCCCSHVHQEGEHRIHWTLFKSFHPNGSSCRAVRELKLGVTHILNTWFRSVPLFLFLFMLFLFLFCFFKIYVVNVFNH